MSVPYAAGALRSTAEDMARWNAALFGGKLPRPESLKEMLTPERLRNGAETETAIAWPGGKAFPPPAGYVPGSYAFGLEHHSENGRRIIGHDGSIAGFDAMMQTYVDEGLTIIVLTSTNNAAHPLEAKIAKLLTPQCARRSAYCGHGPAIANMRASPEIGTLVQLPASRALDTYSRMLLNRPRLCGYKNARSAADARHPVVARQMAATIKRLLPGVAIAVLACVQAEGQESAQADFRGISAPIDVRRMADWVVVSADNIGLPFIVVDKKDAEVFVFDRRGQILGAAPALLGLAVGDDSAPGVGNKPLSAIPTSDRTTPAGRFVAYMGHEPGKPNFLWVDYKDNISLHRVIVGRPQDHRFQRLASPTALDNRISFGCINVPIDFFDRTVLPTFKGTQGVVYIMPEIKATRDVFPNYYDVDGRLASQSVADDR